MNKPGFSGKPPNLPSDSGDDIPVALRDTPDVASNTGLTPLVWLIGGVTGFILLAIVSGFVFSITAPKKTINSELSSPNSVATTTPTPDNVVLGHLAYPEAPESELTPISADGRIKMRKTAAEKFRAMKQAAQSAGVTLSPISGFRSVQEQKQLFFDVGAQRNQTPAQRAALSAPPGYSEHHTGYATDIGDGTVPATNLQANFDQTKAFEWLQANAARFGFEMSFPKNNPQGVSYEPWHWRFVGDRQSLELFYKARNLKPIPASP